MTALQAFLMGLVEGITEYLPVSSTGHLLLAQHLLGIDAGGKSNTAIAAYEICIQAGAIFAVLFLYAKRVRSVFAGIFGHDPMGRQLAWNLVTAFLPAAVIGVLFEKQIKSHLFGMWPVVLAWLIGGLAILIFTRRYEPAHTAKPAQQLEQMTILQALIIGCIQCIAMWPGTSRSLVTILGGMLAGLSAIAAIEFSFLLGLITLSAATVFESLKHGTEIINTFGLINPLIGFVTAFLAAMAAVKWMVAYLNRNSLAVFGYYRVALGVAVASFMVMDFIK
ncbi:MAG: undecaprenyl-diphosphate phosphatase [Bdellovibrionota bacterium]